MTPWPHIRLVLPTTLNPAPTPSLAGSLPKPTRIANANHIFASEIGDALDAPLTTRTTKSTATAATTGNQFLSTTRKVTIGRNELAQEVTGVVMRKKPGGSWAHQIDLLQVLALQPVADSGNTNIELPRGTIMGDTWHGYTSPEKDEAALWRTIQQDSGYNMPHR